jgi:hypothetical protein
MVNRIPKVRVHFEEAPAAVRSLKVQPCLKEALEAAQTSLGLELVNPVVWSQPVTPAVLGDDPLDRWKSSPSGVSPTTQWGQ